MFTGIIETLGTIQSISKQGDGICLKVAVKKLPKSVKLGSSVAVNGVCLTVAQMKKSMLTFDVMEESVGKTTIEDWAVGGTVNVEPSLRLGDEVGGHFVFGHVDTVGKIKRLKDLKTSRLMTIGLPKKLMRYIVPQGSVAIDGVSLTVARVGKSDFTVSLVDFTLKHTTLKYLKKGDRVNIECDMLAKYAFGN